MKFYSVKAMLLAFALIGLCPASPARADDKYVIDIQWLEKRVNDVCPSKDSSPVTCAPVIETCLKDVKDKIVYKIEKLEQCPFVLTYDWVWECSTAQANNVIAYIDSTLKGTAWGHPESVENAKKCVASVKSFPSGAQPAAATTEDKPETVPVKAKEIIEGFCAVPLNNIEKPACKSARDQCQTKTATALLNMLINAHENPSCTMVMTPNGPRNVCETCELIEIAGEDQHVCTPATLDQIKINLANMDSKEGFSKEAASACSNLQMGDGSHSSGPPPPAMGDGRPDSSATNPSFQTTGTNSQASGGSGCSLSSSKSSPSLGMLALALAAAMALHLSKRKSF